MKLVNIWKSVFKNKTKQYDKLDLTIRISALTILKIKVDLSSKYLELTILNFSFRTK